MNKTVSIHINGKIYNLEEQAYELIDRFLKKTRSNLTHELFSNQVTKDVEIVIAEYFSEMTKDKEVIVLDEALSIIQKITGNNEIKSDKKLFRDSDDGIVAGVSGGLASYWGIDAIWIRLPLIILLFVYGLGVLIYLLLWLLIPRAKSTADKLQMKAIAVTVDNIAEKIKYDFEATKIQNDWSSEQDIEIWNKDGWQSKTAYFFDRLTQQFAKVFARFFQFSGRFVGVFMFLLGFVLLVVLYITTFQVEPLSRYFLLGKEYLSIDTIGNLTFENQKFIKWFKIGFFISIASPLLAMILGGIVLWFKRFRGRSLLGAINGLLFIIGLSILFTLSVLAYRDFRKSALSKEEITFNKSNNSVMQVSINTSPNPKFDRTIGFSRYKILYHDKEPFISGYININIKKSATEQYHLRTYKYSCGKNEISAADFTRKIQHYSKILNQQIVINNYFTLKNTSKIRNQRCDVNIEVPENGSLVFVQLPSDTKLMAKNEDGNTINIQKEKTYKMKSSGLFCLDCDN